MKTKFVYVVVANQFSVFLEEAYTSIWSLKYHNEGAYVSVVMDARTKEYYESTPYTELKAMVDEIISIPFDDSISNHVRSRWLKTNLRTLVKEDFMFLDTDTVVAGNLKQIDDLLCTIGAVPDSHQELPGIILKKFLSKYVKKYFNISEINEKISYFNSGVILAKDVPEAYEFFKNWHNNWKRSNSMGFKYDQLPLFVTDMKMGGVISPLADVYNYQVSQTLKFLNSSLILHFYPDGTRNLVESHPFFGEKWYRDIKEDGTLSIEKKDDIVHCKNIFSLQTKLIGGEEIQFWSTSSIVLLKRIYRCKPLFFVTNYLSRISNFILRKIGTE